MNCGRELEGRLLGMSGQDRRASQLDGGLVRCRRESAVGIKLPNWCRRASVPMGVTTVTVSPLYDRAREGGGAEAQAEAPGEMQS